QAVGLGEIVALAAPKQFGDRLVAGELYHQRAMVRRADEEAVADQSTRRDSNAGSLRLLVWVVNRPGKLARLEVERGQGVRVPDDKRTHGAEIESHGRSVADFFHR